MTILTGKNSARQDLSLPGFLPKERKSILNKSAVADPGSLVNEKPRQCRGLQGLSWVSCDLVSYFFFAVAAAAALAVALVFGAATAFVVASDAACTFASAISVICLAICDMLS